MATPDRTVALLVSPFVGPGGGHRLRGRVAERLRAGGCAVRHLWPRDVEDVAPRVRAAVAAGAEAVVVVGGDGTFHQALQAVAGTAVPLGLVPAGTGNDVARHLDLPRDDVDAAVDVVLRGRTTVLDAARAGDRWFMTVLAAGFDAVVNERANRMTWPRGHSRYTLATLAELRTFRPLPYVLELDGRTLRLDAMLVAVGNGPSFGGGLRICEGADLHDGLLDVVVIRPVSRAELVRTYPKLYRGTHTSHPQYEHHRVRRVTVAAPGVVGYADGERLGALPLTIECVPDAVKVFT